MKRPSNDIILRLLYNLNKLPYIHNWVSRIIKQKLGLPSSTHIMPGFYCSSPNLEIGENTGLGNLFILAYAKVKIGHHCSFSFNNMIITSSHDYTNFGTIIAKPVTIGNNVWITSNVIILPGVTIGNNSIIGAGSVVTKDIPSGVFAAGNPCKVIKHISFSIENKFGANDICDNF